MNYWVWLAVGFVFLVMEIFSLSFYMLVVGAAFIVTGLIEYFFHTSLNGSLAIASVMSIIGMISVNIYRRNNKKYIDFMSQEDDFDIGAITEVIYFDEQGIGQVMYRGVQWQARLNDAHTHENLDMLVGGKAKITAKEANLLIVEII